MISFTGGKIEHIAVIPPLRFLITNTKVCVFCACLHVTGQVSRNTKALVSHVRSVVTGFPAVATHLLDAVHEISLGGPTPPVCAQYG